MPRPTLPGRRPTAPSDRRASERGQLLVDLRPGDGRPHRHGRPDHRRRRHRPPAARPAERRRRRRDGRRLCLRQRPGRGGRGPGRSPPPTATSNGTNNTTVTVNIGLRHDHRRRDAPAPQLLLGDRRLQLLERIDDGHRSWPATRTAPTGRCRSSSTRMRSRPTTGPERTRSRSASPASGSEDVPLGDRPVQLDALLHRQRRHATATGDTDRAIDAIGHRPELINDEGTSTVIYLDDEIGPAQRRHAHTALLRSLRRRRRALPGRHRRRRRRPHSAGRSFHLTGSVGGSTKQISG